MPTSVHFKCMGQLRKNDDPNDRMIETTGLVAAAERAAVECGNFLLESFKQPKGGYEEKGPGDLVSEIDRESQRMAKQILLEYTPGAQFLCEEDTIEEADDPSSDELTWIIDPLDGTANFLHRLPLFAVSIAAARGRTLLAAAICSPFTEEVFTAAPGHGAALNGEQIQVSEEKDLGRSMVATGWPFRQKEILAAYLEVFTRIFWATQGIRRMGAAAIDLAYTAAGRLEGFWEYGLKKWDVAAGALILSEAGGMVSDFAGSDGWWESGDIVASNGLIHSALLETTSTPNGIADLQQVH